MAKKKPKIKNEDKAKKLIMSELKIADEMRKASKQLLGTNTARPEVLRRAKRYAKLSNELSMRADDRLKALRGSQKTRDSYSKRYGDK
jgi:hypothetical protein